jgi:hypothetical protein
MVEHCALWNAYSMFYVNCASHSLSKTGYAWTGKFLILYTMHIWKQHWHTLRDSLSDLSLTPFKHHDSGTKPREGGMWDAVELIVLYVWVASQYGYVHFSFDIRICIMIILRGYTFLDDVVFGAFCYPYSLTLLVILDFYSIGLYNAGVSCFKIFRHYSVHTPQPLLEFWLLSGYDVPGYDMVLDRLFYATGWRQIPCLVRRNLTRRDGFPH